MSVEVMSWVLNDAPTDSQGEMLVLLGLANHAERDGTNARPSQATMAKYARCTDRSVRNHLAALEARGLIRRGDQQAVAHLDPRHRPIVWDLAIELSTSRPENISGLTSPGRKIPAVRPENPGSPGRKPVSDKPSLEPSLNRPYGNPLISGGIPPTLAALRSADLCPHEAIIGQCALCRITHRQDPDGSLLAG